MAVIIPLERKLAKASLNHSSGNHASGNCITGGLPVPAIRDVGIPYNVFRGARNACQAWTNRSLKPKTFSFFSPFKLSPTFFWWIFRWLTKTVEYIIPMRMMRLVECIWALDLFLVEMSQSGVNCHIRQLWVIGAKKEKETVTTVEELWLTGNIPHSRIFFSTQTFSFSQKFCMTFYENFSWNTYLFKHWN